MPFHMAAFAQSVLTAGTFQEIDAVEDEILFTSGKDVRVAQGLDRLIGYGASGSSTVQARIEAPNLRGFLNQAVAEAADGPGIAPPDNVFRQLFGDPLPLVAGESLTFLSDGGGDGVTAKDVALAALFADGTPQSVTGDIRTVRAVSTIVNVPRVWASSTLTFDEDLPGGRFQLVGASATVGHPFRFVIAGQSNRPGGYGKSGIQNRDIPGQRRGGWGVWGEFDVNRPPTLEVLQLGSVSNNPVVFLDLIMLG